MKRSSRPPRPLKFAELFGQEIIVPKGEITQLLNLKAGNVTLGELIKASAEAAKLGYDFYREAGVLVEVPEGMSLGEVTVMHEEISELRLESEAWQVLKLNHRTELGRIQENIRLGRAVFEAVECLQMIYEKRSGLLDFMARRADPKLIESAAKDLAEEVSKNTKSTKGRKEKILGKEIKEAFKEVKQSQKWSEIWSTSSSLLKGIGARVLDNPERKRER